MDALNCLVEEYRAIANSKGSEKKIKLNHSFGIRILLISVFVAFFALASNATVYYISSSGNDGNSGTSITSPWKSLEKVNSFSFSPGDQVLFKRGESWIGTLKPRTSGASGNPIVYGAYGTGEKPKIYGSEVITGWTRHSGNIYKATVSNDINQLFLNGKRVQLARMPKSGYYNVTGVTSSTTFTSSNISGAINHTGANAIIRTNRWGMATKSVTVSSSQTLTINSAPYYSITVGDGFFVNNKLEYLTAAGEYYFDTNQNTVYLWTPNGDSPANYEVRGSVVNNLIYLNNKDYVTIENLELLHSSGVAVNTDFCDYLTINGVDIINPESKGTYINHDTHGTYTNITVDGANHIGFHAQYTSYSNISSNTIRNTALFHNLGLTGMGGEQDGRAISSTAGTDNVFRYNVIENTGYSALSWRTPNTIIDRNIIKNSCLVKDDGGAIYTWSANSSEVVADGSEVTNNIIINSIGTSDGTSAGYPAGYGIYLDNNIQNVLVQGNTIQTAGGGIFLNSGNGGHTIKYNTVIDASVLFLAETLTSACSITNNTFYGVNNVSSFIWWKNSNQRLIKIKDQYPNLDFNQYVHHYSESNLFDIGSSVSWEDWKNYTKGEQNSKIDNSPLGSGEVEEIFINDSKSPKLIELGNTIYKNLNGERITENITLQPFTSIILIKTSESISTADETKPVISSFDVPSSSASLTVPVNSIVANDNIGITGYLLTESSTTSNLTNANWSSSIPTSYTFSSGGNKTLYAWVKDAAGNISDSKSASIVISTSVSSTLDLGNTELYSNKTYDNNHRAMPVTFSEEAIITSISIYHEAGSGSFVMGVYADLDNKPSSRLGMTPTTEVSPKAGWQTVELASPVVVSSGQTVWLSWLFENNPGIRWASGTPGRASSSNTWSSGMPETFGSANIASYIYSIYCTTSVPGDSEMNTTPKEINISEEIIICEGDSYEGWTTSGTYQRTLTATSGADSIVTTNLIVNPVYQVSEEISIIEGENYLGWTESGVYERTLTTITGCDSIVTTQLSVALHKNTTEEIIICEGDSYEGWITSGSYQRTLTAVSGADSIVTTNLTVNMVYQVSEEISILEGENYLGWTESGIYERTLISVTGCDSIVITNLTVNSIAGAGSEDSKISTSVSVDEYINICEGSTYEGWSMTGTYQRTLTAESGIDSIVTTYLTVNPVVNTIENVTIFEGENYLGWTEPGQYERILTSISGCDSIVVTNLSVNPIQSNTTQKIVLEKGWNIFSTNLITENPDLEVIMQGLSNSGDLLEVQDELGNIFDRQNAKVGWVNNIGAINITEGYKIRVKFDCILEINGKPASLPLNIMLHEGENIISFPYPGTVDAIKVIQPLIDAGILIKVQDEKGNSIENWGEPIGWVNGIGNFKEGEGYIVTVSNSGVLPIFDGYEKSAGFIVNNHETEYFKVNYEGNGFRHMNINISDLQDIKLQVGDEIAAFDGDICVGAVKLNEFNLQNDLVSINASSSDYTANNGFVEGNQIMLKVWKINDDSNFQPEVELKGGDLEYVSYGSVFVDLISQEITSINDVKNIEFDMYPNPTIDIVNIRFSEIPKPGTSIILTNVSGNEILRKEVVSTNVVLDVESQPAGMYFIRILAGNELKVEKLIKN